MWEIESRIVQLVTLPSSGPVWAFTLQASELTSRLLQPRVGHRWWVTQQQGTSPIAHPSLCDCLAPHQALGEQTNHCYLILDWAEIHMDIWSSSERAEAFGMPRTWWRQLHSLTQVQLLCIEICLWTPGCASLCGLLIGSLGKRLKRKRLHGKTLFPLCAKLGQ